jgi:F-type H+-transporting ATPase subunit delta
VSVQARARPQDYAQAIYDLALEEWTRQLGDVLRALNEDAALEAAMEDTKIGVGERLRQLDRVTPGGLSERVRKFLGTLLDAGQIDQIDAILVELERLVHRLPRLEVARITSAVPLTPDEQAALRDKLVQRFGADLEFQFEVDDSLLGGIHLRVGDRVIDGSVAGRLAALRDRLTQ